MKMITGRKVVLPYCFALLIFTGGITRVVSEQAHSGVPDQLLNSDKLGQDETHDIRIRDPSYHDFLVGSKRFNEDNYFSFLTGEKKSHGPGGDAAYWDFVNGEQWKKRNTRLSNMNMRKRRSANSNPQSVEHSMEAGVEMNSDYSALSDKRNMDWSEFVVGKRGVNKRLNYDDFIVG